MRRHHRRDGRRLLPADSRALWREHLRGSKWSQRFRHTGSIAAKPMGGDRRSRLKGVRGWLAACRRSPPPHLDQMQDELLVTVIRVRRMALRRFLKKSIIETGNERGVGREVGNAKVPCHRECEGDGRSRLAGFAQSAKRHKSGAHGGQKRNTDPAPNIRSRRCASRILSKGGDACGGR
jgi:hypothetical protein